MVVKALTERQLFGVKRENLEKRIAQYYLETQDSETVLEYGMAVLIFNGITMDNYSFVCKDLMKEIFLTCEPTEKMRDYCLYFYDFFEYSEWEQVRDRLFSSRAAFSERTREIRPETVHFRAATAPTNRRKDWLYENYVKDEGETRAEKERYYYAYEAVFRDENGRKNVQKFRNADVGMSSERYFALLNVLTRLTIFKKKGVRRFYELEFRECRSLAGYRFYADKEDDAAFMKRRRELAKKEWAEAPQ